MRYTFEMENLADKILQPNLVPTGNEVDCHRVCKTTVHPCVVEAFSSWAGVFSEPGRSTEILGGRDQDLGRSR